MEKKLNDKMDRTLLSNRIDPEIQNNLPAGSYIIKDGKLIPNPDDDEMKAREEKLKNPGKKEKE